SAQLMEADGIDALCELILDTALSTLHADFASLQLLDSERGAGGELRLLGYRGLSGEAARFWEWVRPGSPTTCGMAMQSGQRVAVADIERCEFIAGSDDRAAYRQAGIRAAQTTPLVSRGGDLLGAFSTHWRERHELTPDEQRTLDVLAREASDLIERARAEEALRTSEARYRTLFEHLFEERARLQAIIDTIPTGLFIVDLDGAVTSTNDEARRIWAGDVPLRGFGDYVAYKGSWPDTGARLAMEEWPAAQALLHDRTTKAVAVDIERFDGTMGTVLFSGAPIKDDAGSTIGAVVAMQDITKRKQAEDALAAANAKLREADRRKDEFLAMLAHELRNPLAAISSAVKLLQMPDAGAGAVRRAREAAARQATHMTRLVDDLLDVSRITQGKVTLKQENVSLADVIDTVAEGARAGIQASGQRLYISLPHQAPAVVGDPVRLAQMVSNLLSNATKYTPHGGEIHLAVDRIGVEAVIRVRDNGAGIPADLLPQVFDLFVQGQRGPDRTQGGLGIGLTMVRRLAELHGGRVEARSEGLNRGSEFSIYLPASPELPVPLDQPPCATASGTTRRVLIVDDNADAAELLAMLLRREGHDVLVALDGLAALDLARAHPPDTILLDLGMPAMDGFELGRRVRGEPALAQTMLVALTGYGGDDDRERTRAAGFDHHLVKPVDMDVLCKVLQQERAAPA
ncbi:MAG TPA: ATP-binding protein, partial [Vicinamibacterales bacterium]|nr:ATP-binding protein [Vicinamibacterales bacterium]